MHSTIVSHAYINMEKTSYSSGSSSSADYPSNNLFCKRALRCAISMTGRWSLSCGFSSSVYLAFFAPSRPSLFLTSVFCCSRPRARLMCTNLSNRLQLDLSLQTEETTRTVSMAARYHRTFLRGWLIEDPASSPLPTDLRIMCFAPSFVAYCLLVLVYLRV